MQYSNRVLWAEGILLRPQHFQQWERYHQHCVDRRARALSQHCFGIIDWDYSRSDLNKGIFTLENLDMVLPSGEVIFYEHNADEALSVVISKHAVVNIYVGVPKCWSASEIAGYPQPAQAPRYIGQYCKMVDRFDAGREAEVLLGRLNLSLSEDTAKSALHYFQIASIDNQAGQVAKLNTHFIPTTTTLKANVVLTTLLSELLANFNMVKNKINPKHALYAWLIRAMGVMQFYLVNRDVHPERVFEGLFYLHHDIVHHQAWQAKEWRYNHHDLSMTFLPLCRSLREFLNNLEFDPIQPCWQKLHTHLYQTCGLDAVRMQTKKIIIGFSINDVVCHDVDNVLPRIKVASPTAMPQLIEHALPGITLSRYENTHSQSSANADMIYCTLAKHEDAYMQAVKAGRLQCFFPTDVNIQAMELLCV